MAHPTDHELLKLSKETGYEISSIEKTLRLFNILQEVERDGYLRERLALTGGTALNAFHLKLERLSIDIDLIYISPLAEEAARSERKCVDEALSRILDVQGYRIKSLKRTRDGSRWETRFDSAIGGSLALKIDLGHTDRQPLFGASRMSSAELGGRMATDVLVLDIEDVIAGKLAALTQRTAARDLFDALSIADIADALDMESVMAAYLASVAASRNGRRDIRIDGRGASPHEACQTLIRGLPTKYFRNNNEMVAWYNEGIAICREQFGGLLALTHQERRFVDGVHHRGEINADLLNAPPELRARIAAWPRLAWRCRRVRENRK